MIPVRQILFFTGIVFSTCKPTTAQSVLPDSLFNKIFREAKGGWIAGDATYSIALPDGRTLFLMGDSFIGEVINEKEIAPGAKMIRNCALLFDKDTLTSIYNGTFENPSDFIQTSLPDSTWYWPEHGTVENDTLKIFLAKYTTNPQGTPGWNFKYIGHDIAYFLLPEIHLIGIYTLPYYDANNVMYGDRLMKDNSYTYIYGRKEEDVSGYSIPYPHVARSQYSIKNQWEFYNGENWSTDTFTTKKFNSFQVSQQYSIFQHKNKYILITQDIWLSPEIYSFISTTPVGPWENKTLIYSTPIDYDETFTYNAYAHPQFDENNHLLVSYNSNGDFRAIFDNIEIYRPKFIRVPYQLIDPEFTSSINPHSPKKIEEVFDVYPNPAVDLIYIYLDNVYEDKISLKVYNLNGTLKKEKKISGPAMAYSSAIEVGNLQAGIYILVLQSDKLFLTRKFAITNN